MGFLECYTVADPTRVLPEDVGFRMEETGMKVVDVSNWAQKVLFDWPWSSIVAFSGVPTSDPTDMDEFVLTVMALCELAVLLLLLVWSIYIPWYNSII